MIKLKDKGFTEEDAFKLGIKYGDVKYTGLINLIIEKKKVGNSGDEASKEALIEWEDLKLRMTTGDGWSPGSNNYSSYDSDNYDSDNYDSDDD